MPKGESTYCNVEVDFFQDGRFKGWSDSAKLGYLAWWMMAVRCRRERLLPHQSDPQTVSKATAISRQSVTSALAKCEHLQSIFRASSRHPGAIAPAKLEHNSSITSAVGGNRPYKPLLTRDPDGCVIVWGARKKHSSLRNWHDEEKSSIRGLTGGEPGANAPAEPEHSGVRNGTERSGTDRNGTEGRRTRARVAPDSVQAPPETKLPSVPPEEPIPVPILEDPFLVGQFRMATGKAPTATEAARLISYAREFGTDREMWVDSFARWAESRIADMKYLRGCLRHWSNNKTPIQQSTDLVESGGLMPDDEPMERTPEQRRRTVEAIRQARALFDPNFRATIASADSEAGDQDQEEPPDEETG